MISKSERAIGKDIFFSFLNSYSQVFFSTSKLLALFLVVISFFDYGAGIGGAIAVVIANLMAYFMGYNSYFLKSGLYGFNSLLVGLGIGLIFQPSIELYVLVAVATSTCFFFTIAFQGVLGKYGLPFLSLPFLITIWIVSLSGSQLTMLNISERGIYTYNEIYGLGGHTMVNLYNWLEILLVPPFFVFIFIHWEPSSFKKDYLPESLFRWDY